MSTTIPIDNAGRLVLPKAIRDQMHLSGGSKVEIKIVGDRIELIPEAEPFKIEYDEDGLPIITGWEGYDAGQAVLAAREEQLDRL